MRETAVTDEGAVNDILELLKVNQDEIKRECRKSIKRFTLAGYISQIEQLFEEVINS